MNLAMVALFIIIIALIVIITTLTKQNNYKIKEKNKTLSSNLCIYTKKVDEIEKKEKTFNYPYISKKYLFTPAERSFLGVLEQTVGEDIRVFGKVRVADVIEPLEQLSRSEWQSAFNRIQSKHFDFVLCNKNDLSIICAIELNDRSHRGRKRIQRDEFLKNVCEAVNIPLIQVPTKFKYAIPKIKEVLSSQGVIQDLFVQRSTSSTY